MPAIQNIVQVGAAASNSNIVAGSAFEYARGRQALSLGVVASAIGSFITIQAGADVILEESPPFVAATAGQYPRVPDEMFYNDILEAFDRLRIAARNPTGGAIDFRFVALLTPLA